MQESNNVPSPPKIVLPVGTRTVTVRETPHLLALALYPITSPDLDTLQVIHRILKRQVDPDDDEQPLGKLEPLTEEDWSVLFKIWRTLPPYRDGMTHAEWRPYAMAFEQAQSRPDYELWPVWDDATDLREEARKLYYALLHEAISNGSITPRNSAHIPIVNATGEVLMSAEIMVSDLNKFVAQCHGGASHRHPVAQPNCNMNDDRHVEGSAQQAVSDSHSFPPGSWKAKAYEIGREWMLSEEKRTGKRPGQVAIATYLEGELSNRGITAKRGKFADQAYIRRNVLKGITGRTKNGKK